MGNAEEIPVVQGSVDILSVPQVLRPDDVSNAEDTIKAGAVWIVADTDRKVHFVTPTHAEVSGGEESLRDRIFSSTGEAQEFLEGEGYSYSHIRGKREFVVEGEKLEISPEDEAQIVTRLDQEIGASIDRCQTIVDEITALSEKANALDRKGRARKVDKARKNLKTILSQCDNSVQQVGILTDEDEAEIVQLDEGVLHIDAELVVKKRERRDKFAGVVGVFEGLLVQAVTEMESLETSASYEKNEKFVTQKFKKNGQGDNGMSGELPIGNVAGSNGNLATLLQVQENARIVSNDGETKEGGSGESEKPEGFETLLKARQEKVSVLIDAITSPESFAEFRRGMRKVQLEGFQEARWYFINQKMLQEEVNKNENLKEVRELSNTEKQRLYTLEDFLRDKMRRRFFELKDADVARFYDQEQVRVVATQSEADLDALAESWPKQLEDIVTWKGLLDVLTEVEKNKIDAGYRDAIATLRQNTEIRRGELQMAPAYQALDVFLTRPGGKERIALLQDIVREAYRVFSESVDHESEGKMSKEECWELWQEKKCEQKLQKFVVNQLHALDKVDEDEGEKIFRAMIEKLQEGR